jgi:hypothetical protein
MCQEWLHFQNSVHDLPPEETELISAAVGRPQLLLSIKLIQFRDLINISEKSLAHETEKPVIFLDPGKYFGTWYGCRCCPLRSKYSHPQAYILLYKRNFAFT